MRILAVAADPALDAARVRAAVAAAARAAAPPYNQVWALGYHLEPLLEPLAASLNAGLLAAHGAHWWVAGRPVRAWDQGSLADEAYAAAAGAKARGHAVDGLALCAGEETPGLAADDPTAGARAARVAAALGRAGVACRTSRPVDVAAAGAAEVAARLPVVWLDFETNGRVPERDALLEVAAIRTDGAAGPERSRFEAKIALPRGERVNWHAAAINGYTPAAWRDARPEAAVIGELLAWLPARFQLAGFSVGYDRRCLRAACGRLGRPEPGWLPKAIDPLYEAQRVLAGVPAAQLPNHKLESLCDYFGISNRHAHRALADCERARAVYLKLLAKEAPPDVLD